MHSSAFFVHHHLFHFCATQFCLRWQISLSKIHLHNVPLQKLIYKKMKCLRHQNMRMLVENLLLVVRNYGTKNTVQAQIHQYAAADCITTQNNRTLRSRACDIHQM